MDNVTAVEAACRQPRRNREPKASKLSVRDEVGRAIGQVERATAVAWMLAYCLDEGGDEHARETLQVVIETCNDARHTLSMVHDRLGQGAQPGVQSVSGSASKGETPILK